MELHLHLLVILTSAAHLRSQTTTRNPYAVTKSFEGLEEMYLRLRDRNPKSDSLLTAKEKWQICKRIFVKGEYLRESINSKAEILLNPVRDETWLKTNRTDIYGDVFERTQTSRSMCIIPGYSTQPFCYVNRSRLRPIHVRGENYPENVFECQAFDRKLIAEKEYQSRSDRVRDSPYSSPRTRVEVWDNLEDVRRYFVSDKDYNVNDVPKGVRVGGRFVFYYDAESNRIALHALAEESTPEIRTNKKAHYLKRRNGHREAENEEDDPICSLDPGRRSRLCHSVLVESTRIFASEANEQGCERRSFTLKHDDPDKIQYSEWMLRCSHGRFASPLVYVSRAYKDNEVFLHSMRGIELTMKLSGYKKRVAVVRDRPKRTKKSGEGSSASAAESEGSERTGAKSGQRQYRHLVLTE